MVNYLQSRRYVLKREGSSYRIGDGSLKGITGHEQKWFNHYTKSGGGAIKFLQEIEGYTFQDAVTELIGGEHKLTNEPIEYVKKKTESEPKEFAPPDRASNNKKIMYYLTQKRLIDKNVVDFFISEKKIYQDEKYGNVVFCGFDENGKWKFANLRGIYDGEKAFKGSVSGSDGSYSFNHVSTNKKLFVFESAIDILSFISIYRNGNDEWMNSSFIALDGLAEAPMLKFLENNDIESVVLCLDHDEAGIEATQKLQDLLVEENITQVTSRVSKYKDWNEYRKAKMA